MKKRANKNFTGFVIIAIFVLGLFAISGCIGQEEEGPITTTKIETTTLPGETKPVTRTVVETVTPGPAFDATELTYAWATGIMHTDPAFETTLAGTWLQYMCYDRLVEYDIAHLKATGEFLWKPSLAESWDANADKSVWTFHLRDDATFYSSGNAVDAAAIKFSFERVQTLGETFGAPGASLFNIGYPAAPIMETIEVVDEWTIKFTLKQSYPPFLNMVGCSAGGIMDPTVVEHDVDGDLGLQWILEHESMGSGPFILDHWISNEELLLLRNDNYWGLKPKLEKILIKDVKEATTQMFMLTKGDVDGAHNLGYDMIETLKQQEGYSVYSVPSMNIVKLAALRCWDPTDPPAHPKVRQALRYAIPYEAIVTGLSRGVCSVQQYPIGKGLFAHNPDLAYYYKQDLDKARALLAETPWPTGFTTDLRYYDTTTGGVAMEDVALIIKDELAKIGIECNVIAMTGSAFWGAVMTDLDEATPGWQHDVRGLGLARNGAQLPDPDSATRWIYTVDDNLIFGYYNSSLDTLLEEAVMANDPAERQRLYDEWGMIYLQDGASMQIFQAVERYVFADYVKDVLFNDFKKGPEFQITYKEAPMPSAVLNTFLANLLLPIVAKIE